MLIIYFCSHALDTHKLMLNPEVAIHSENKSLEVGLGLMIYMKTRHCASPISTAHLSSRRKPGTVFRVSKILEPCASLTISAVAVAMPLIL